jgi:hypothetical protein
MTLGELVPLGLVNNQHTVLRGSERDPGEPLSLEGP